MTITKFTGTYGILKLQVIGKGIDAVFCTASETVTGKGAKKFNREITDAAREFIALEDAIDAAHVEALEINKLFSAADAAQDAATYVELPENVYALRVTVYGWVQGKNFEWNTNVWTPSEGLSLVASLENTFGNAYENGFIVKLEIRLGRAWCPFAVPVNGEWVNHWMAPADAVAEYVDAEEESHGIYGLGPEFNMFAAREAYENVRSVDVAEVVVDQPRYTYEVKSHGTRMDGAPLFGLVIIDSAPALPFLARTVYDDLTGEELNFYLNHIEKENA